MTVDEISNYINPDISFIQKLKKDCGASLKSCMQCGTCSVVCQLSPSDKPFPRKEMIWSAWGLKEKIYGDPDIWLCHQCGECSSYCPRDVKPANVVSALRQNSYMHYARPKFIGKMLNDPRFLPIVIAVPLFTILLILYLAGTLDFPEGDINFSVFFPHKFLNSIFMTVVLLVMAGNLVGLVRFWKDMKMNMPLPKQNNIIGSTFGVIKDILLHKYFGKCSNNKSRTVAHGLIFWGFVSLLLVTVAAIVAVALKIYPLNFTHPVKIAGNIAGIMLIVGTIIMIIQRLAKKDGVSNSNYFDWSFLIALLLLGITGGLTEVARFGNWSTAYYIYSAHLVLVWLIVMYAPFSKFGHFIFRTVALVYARSVGRKII